MTDIEKITKDSEDKYKDIKMYSSNDIGCSILKFLGIKNLDNIQKAEIKLVAMEDIVVSVDYFVVEEETLPFSLKEENKKFKIQTELIDGES